MQIKQFYLDLREGPQYAQKQNNLRLLESEAFKEPLKFTFELDSGDKKEMEKIKSDCKEYYDRLISTTERLEESIKRVEEKEETITKSYQKIENLIDKYESLLSEQKRKEEQINKKGLEDNKLIGDLHQEINDIKKEISLPRPQKIYSNTWDEFVSGLDVYYGKEFKLPHGDYYVIEQYEYEPQNDYVINEDKIVIRSIHLNGRYIPGFQLEANTALDKPVSKVRLTVLFFQI